MTSPKIKQLAEQAIMYATDNGWSDAVYRPTGFLASVSTSFADKFAELIIAECISAIAEKSKVEGDAILTLIANKQYVDSYDNGYMMGIATGSDVIKQRFDLNG